MADKYVLNVASDVDGKEPELLLWLPYGWRFYDEVVHVRGYDTMDELRLSANNDVVSCDCKDCANHPAGKPIGGRKSWIFKG